MMTTTMIRLLSVTTILLAIVCNRIVADALSVDCLTEVEGPCILVCCIDCICCGPGTTWDEAQEECVRGTGFIRPDDFVDKCYEPACEGADCCGPCTILVTDPTREADSCYCVPDPSCSPTPRPTPSGSNMPFGMTVGPTIGPTNGPSIGTIVPTGTGPTGTPTSIPSLAPSVTPSGGGPSAPPKEEKKAWSVPVHVNIFKEAGFTKAQAKEAVKKAGEVLSIACIQLVIKDASKLEYR